MDAAQHVYRSRTNERGEASTREQALTNERLTGTAVGALCIPRIDSVDERIAGGIVNVIFTGDQVFTSGQFVHPRTRSKHVQNCVFECVRRMGKLCEPVVSIARAALYHSIAKFVDVT